MKNTLRDGGVSSTQYYPVMGLGHVAPSDKYGDHNTTLQTVQQIPMNYLQLGLESFRFVLF